MNKITEYAIIIVASCILSYIIFTCYFCWEWLFKDLTAMRADVQDIKDTLNQYSFKIK